MNGDWPQGFDLRDILQKRSETTRLSPEQEAAFQRWVQQNRITADVDSPFTRFDYRGAFLAKQRPTISPVDKAPHWPDTFKQRGHPTFSNESRYSRGPLDGGSWKGEVFTPSPTEVRRLPGLLDMLRNILGPEEPRG